MISEKQLHELHGALLRKNRLESLLPELESRRAELSAQVETLRSRSESEQADVDALEKRGLASLFYELIGKKEEKLTRERAEAAAAAAKYYSARRELDAVESDIAAYETELLSLADARERYESALAERIEEIKSKNLPGADELISLGERCADIDARLREVYEAVAAGETARGTVNEILSSLDDAEGWGTWDLIGGGLISGIAKHGCLDDAQELVPRLQTELRRFQSELGDVDMDIGGIDISADGFLRFADLFFDGLFADLAALDHIRDAQTQVENAAQKIDAALSRLHWLTESLTEQRGKLCTRMEALAAGEK